MSLELQQAFGLRREEAMKIRPCIADQGDHLFLQGSWTKGGRKRIVPIRTEQQQEVLDRDPRLAGRGSLIPSSRNYAPDACLRRQHLKGRAVPYARHVPRLRPGPL